MLFSLREQAMSGGGGGPGVVVGLVVVVVVVVVEILGWLRPRAHLVGISSRSATLSP